MPRHSLPSRNPLLVESNLSQLSPNHKGLCPNSLRIYHPSDGGMRLRTQLNCSASPELGLLLKGSAEAMRALLEL